VTHGFTAIGKHSKWSATGRNGDLLGAHERILGVKIAELACNESLETVLFDRPCSHLLQGLGDDEAVVLASMSGIAGDCGAYSAQMFLMSPHSKHYGLAENEALFQRALGSREVLWVAPTHTVTHGSPCQATALGLFNSQHVFLLPRGANETESSICC